MRRDHNCSTKEEDTAGSEILGGTKVLLYNNRHDY